MPSLSRIFGRRMGGRRAENDTHNVILPQESESRVAISNEPVEPCPPASRLYKSLGPNEIRLVQVMPGFGNQPIEMNMLQRVNLALNPQYFTLSYVWGDPALSRKVKVNGEEMAITENLANFLICHRQLLVNNLRTLWIDAICINQADTEERNAQVLLMGQLYQQAELTMVWLGIKRAECAKGLELIENIPSIDNLQRLDEKKAALEQWLEVEANVTLAVQCWKSFKRLINLPWFNRIWIKQEYLVSASIEVWYGAQQLLLTDFYSPGWLLHNAQLFQRALRRLPEHLWQETMDAQDLATRMNLISTLVNDRKFRQEGATGYTMLRFLFMYRNSAATDPRDKIYGILGLLSNPSVQEAGYDQKLLIVDYKATVQVVYTSLVRSVIASTRSLNILSACQSSGLRDMPSWVPDWSSPWRKGFALMENKIGNPYQGTSPGEDFAATRNSQTRRIYPHALKALPVSGIIVDSIDEVWNSIDSLLPTDPVGDERVLEEYRQHAYRWLQRSSQNKFLTAESRTDALWQCITSMLHSEDKHSWKFRQQKHKFEEWISNLSDHNYEVRMVGHSLYSRCTMIGKHGYILIGPKDSLPGDLIYVLLGCDVPVILRREGGQFKLIGECYVHGIMHGEMMDAVDAGLAEVEDFELH